MKMHGVSIHLVSSGVLATLLLVLLVALPVPAAPQAGEEQVPTVSGPVEAVEKNRNSIIVDGRRFQLASRVHFDGVEVGSDRALHVLSVGDMVILQDVESSYDQVTRIRSLLN